MKYVPSALICFHTGAFAAIQICNTGCVDQTTATVIAEDAFIEFTHHQVIPYSIRLLDEDSAEWVFAVDKLEQPCPGDEWFIEVERKTGKVLSVRRGE